MAKREYQNWEGEITILQFHQAHNSYRVTNGEKELWITPGKTSTVPQLVEGQKYTVTLGNEIGKKTWYLNGVVGFVAPPKEKEKEGKSMTSSSNSEGQSRGNYRNNASTFIIHYYDKHDKFPDDEVERAFNETLENFEHGYFDELEPIEPSTPTETTAPSEAQQEVQQEVKEVKEVKKETCPF